MSARIGEGGTGAPAAYVVLSWRGDNFPLVFGPFELTEAERVRDAEIRAWQALSGPHNVTMPRIVSMRDHEAVTA